MLIRLRTLHVWPAARRPRFRRTALILLALVGLAAFSVSRESLSGQSSPAAANPNRHVLVVSLDGLGANFYAEVSPKARVPNLQRLRAEGSYAEGVVGVYPSVTYPSHTTIVTGRMPAEHGIYSNNSSRVAGKDAGDWFWFSKDIKVATLWDEARRAHLTSAAISWPVTVGASIDWNVPEIWDPKKRDEFDLEVLAKYATPGLIQEALQALGPPAPGIDNDILRTRFAAFLLKRHRPSLLLLHLADLDNREHEYGPQSAQAVAALETLDIRIGEVLAALAEAGLQDSTDVFIISDHGFLPVERELRPNVLLSKAGLLTVDERGQVTGGKIATLSNGGSFFIYWPDSMDLRSKIDTALKPLRDEGILWGVFDREALKDLGAEPAVKMALDAPAGTSFDSHASGDLIHERASPGGTHGYLPFRSGLESSFIAWGPGIKAGVNLHRIRMTAIGPTILMAMGIDDSQFGAQPPLAEVFKAK